MTSRGDSVRFSKTLFSSYIVTLRITLTESRQSVFVPNIGQLARKLTKVFLWVRKLCLVNVVLNSVPCSVYTNIQRGDRKNSWQIDRLVPLDET